MTTVSADVFQVDYLKLMDSGIRTASDSMQEDFDAECAMHELVVRFGDCEFHGRCSCGAPFGTIRVDESLDVLGLLWERHVMLG